MTRSPPVFVATLGGKAQVLTFALDLLLEQEAITEVHVLHHAPPDPNHRLRRTLNRVRAEFTRSHYGAHPCTLYLVPLRHPSGEPILDLDDPAAVTGVWQTIRQTIGTLKERGRAVHLSVTGGRRLMSLLALSVAALHFTRTDHLWHLYTPEPLRQAAGEGQLLHAPPDLQPPHLLEVPIMPGSDVVPGLRRLLAASPAEIHEARRTLLSDADRRRCVDVWAALTPRQRDVLRLIAGGHTPADVAETLHIQPGTVSSHQHAIYNHCRTVWHLPDDASLDYHWLQQHFGHWREMPRA